MNIALVEKHRDINVDHDWWDCIYDHFTEDMQEKHIVVSDMCFTGFWSQGDGAFFSGYINDTKAFLVTHDIAETYPWVMRLLAMGGNCNIAINRWRTTVFAEVSEACTFQQLVPDGDVRQMVAEQWDHELQIELDGLDNHVTRFVHDYCCDLYRRLEGEYNYLTSDEAVWDAIEANNLEEETM
jgi:hypothetical protein